MDYCEIEKRFYDEQLLYDFFSKVNKDIQDDMPASKQEKKRLEIWAYNYIFTLIERTSYSIEVEDILDLIIIENENSGSKIDKILVNNAIKFRNILKEGE